MKKNIKKIISLLFCVMFAFSAFSTPVTAFAAADDSGSCGSSINYTFDGTTGILTLSGTGGTKTYGAGNTSLTRTPWYSYRTDVKQVIVGEGITSLGMYVFSKLTNLTTVVLPSTLNAIAGYVFYQDALLKVINLGDTAIKTIGINAFEDCTALNSVTLPETMQSIGDFAFRNSGVKSVNFPKTCTSIGQYAFYGCAMSTISLEDTITSVGMRAFANNSFLISVYIYSADLAFGGNDPFNGCQSSLTFYGHSGSTTQTYAEEKGYNFISIDSCTHENTHVVVTLESTCLEKGTQQIVCDDCAQIVRNEEVAALGHDMQAFQVDDQTQKCGHIFTYNRCARCGDTQYDTLTTTHVVDEEGNPVWVEGYYKDTEVTKPTCTVTGVKLRRCTVDDCNKTQLITTPAPGHSVDSWTVTKEATCTTDGEQTGVCTVCGETVTQKIKGEHKYVCVQGEEDATGHRTDVYTCSECNDSYTEAVHAQWIEGQFTTRTLTTASCLMAGASIDTCTVCGETRNNIVPMTGHNYKYTSCDGLDCTYTCRNCNNTTTYTLSKVTDNYIQNLGDVTAVNLKYRYDLNGDNYVNSRDYLIINDLNMGRGIAVPETTTTEE